MLAGIVAAGLLIVVLLYRMRRFLGALTLSAASGLAAMGLVNLTAALTGVFLPFNLFSLAVSLALGVPGVISLLLLRMFW
ncbi:MAG: pro-sigmaK processing inhibitor BofA family protein [Angelakisella sp.]